MDARISSVSGKVMVGTGAGQPEVKASRGMSLLPGNTVVTSGGGRAVVTLTDGSIIVIQPGSVVAFRDFRQAESLRELFEITLGQVRVKINHFAGKPNPYRMNSPTASIAVRGTEFSITVDRTGNTKVVVFDGSVEVASLSDPSRRTLIERGQGVMVAPGFDFQLFTPSASDMNQRAQGGGNDRSNGNGSGSSNSGNNNTKAQAASPGGANGATAQSPGGGGAQGGGEQDQQTPRAQAGTYERYVAGLETLNGLPLLLRYNALPEAYLDSAENPAYATGFHEAEARLYALPSLGGTPESPENPVGSTDSGSAITDFAGASQFSAFVPMDKGKFVIGGSATGSYFSNLTASTGGGQANPGDLGPVTNSGAVISSGKSISRFFDGSLLLATKLGANSFGFQVETLKGTGSLTATLPDPDDPGHTLQDSLTHSSILQTRLTLGFRRELTPRHTLGVFARYGLVDALPIWMSSAPSEISRNRCR